MVETEKNDRKTGRKITKPLCIAQYNKNMRAAGQVDMQNSFSEYLQKTVKWYKKLFFHLFDITVQNSYAMFKMKNEKKLELSEFRLQLARELTEEYRSKRPQMSGRLSTEPPLRLTARHFISFIPGNNVQKCCFVCNHTVKREKSEAIQDFIAQIVMFHCAIPTVSKNIILWKFSDVQILVNLTKINHFRKVEKSVCLIFSQNKPVPKGLKSFLPSVFAARLLIDICKSFNKLTSHFWICTWRKHSTHCETLSNNASSSE